MDKKDISLVFSSDRDLKWLMMGFVIGVIAFFGGGISFAILLMMLIFLIVILFKPEYGILLLPLFVGLDFIIKTYTNGLFGIWDEVLFLLLLSAILIRRVIQKKKFLQFTSIFYPVLLFFLAGLLSISLSPHVTFMQGIEGIRSVLQPFIVFIIIINSEINHKTARFLLFLSLLVAVGAALFGLYQYLAGVASPPNWVDKDLEVGLSRAFSILGSPNAFAAYCVLFAPISLGFLMQPNSSKTQKTIFLLCFLFLFIGILTTLTRAAWLAFIPALFLFGLLAKQTKIVIPLLILLVCSIFVVTPIRQRFTNFFTEKYQEKSEGGGRAYRWGLAKEIFEESPILGRGPGSFGGAVAYRAQAFKGLYVDSYFLEILSNYGLIGILLFLWILLECFRNLIYYAYQSVDSRSQMVGYGILSGLFGFLIHNGTENIWEIIPLAVQFWFLVGIAVLILKKEE
jgi:putative inorganic carbon (HCO3(-)) transporter